MKKYFKQHREPFQEEKSLRHLLTAKMQRDLNNYPENFQREVAKKGGSICQKVMWLDGLDATILEKRAHLEKNSISEAILCAKRIHLSVKPT
jgi:hypothetical protein